MSNVTGSNVTGFQRSWHSSRPPQPDASRIHTLPLDHLHPRIRVAHSRRGALRINQRIIFDHELVLFHSGQWEVTFEQGHVATCEAGHLLLLRPFVPHAIVATSGDSSEHSAIHFDLSPDVPSAAPALDQRAPYQVQLERGLTLPHHVVLGANDAARHELLAILDAWPAGGMLSRLAARVSLERVLLALLDREEASSPESSTNSSARNRARLERAVRHIEQHYDEPIEVASLAAVADLSPSHFNRLFRQWTGYAPAEYLRRQRIARARTLLAQPDLTVKEIAARTGFTDPYHFSKVFRQVDGLSPSAYREAALAGQQTAE